MRERLDKIGLPAAESASPRDFETMLRADFVTSRKIVDHLKLKAD